MAVRARLQRMEAVAAGVVRWVAVVGGSWFLTLAIGELYRSSVLEAELVVFFACFVVYGIWQATAEDEHYWRVRHLVGQLGTEHPEAMRLVLMRLNLRPDVSPWMVRRDSRARAEARRLLDEARRWV